MAAIELQTQEAIDETGCITALESMPAQGFVEATVRRHHAVADRFDDDVGVSLQDGNEALQLGEERLLPLAAHRAEQYVGIGEIGDRLHGGRIRWVEAAELALHGICLHFVRADVRRRATQ